MGNIMCFFLNLKHLLSVIKNSENRSGFVIVIHLGGPVSRAYLGCRW